MSPVSSILNSLLKLSGSIVGRAVRLRLPKPLGRLSVRLYGFLCGSKVEEAEHDIDRYETIADFFVRRLSADARPIGGGVVSPVDCRVVELGRCSADASFKVKGDLYTAAELLGSDELASEFEGGCFMVCYLAPGGYHRIHSPVDGAVFRRIHLGGQCWPVNSLGMRLVPRLFARNERVVSLIRCNSGSVAVVKIGALNVGSIKTTYDAAESVTGVRTDQSAERSEFAFEPPLHVEKGQELGYFEMGSTVVLLLAETVFAPDDCWKEGLLLMGQSIGRLCHEGDG